jgi:hypothetical protein
MTYEEIVSGNYISRIGRESSRQVAVDSTGLGELCLFLRLSEKSYLAAI